MNTKKIKFCYDEISLCVYQYRHLSKFNCEYIWLGPCDYVKEKDALHLTFCNFHISSWILEFEIGKTCIMSKLQTSWDDPHNPKSVEQLVQVSTIVYCKSLRLLTRWGGPMELRDPLKRKRSFGLTFYNFRNSILILKPKNNNKMRTMSQFCRIN